MIRTFITPRGGGIMTEEKKEEKKKENKKSIDKIIYLQFADREIKLDDVECMVLENYDSVKKGEDQPEKIRIYLKPEDRKVYYVINGDFAGEVDIFTEK